MVYHGVNLICESFQKFKVALNPLHRIFFYTLQKVASYHAYHNSIIKNRGHQAHFELHVIKHLKLKLRVFLLGHIVAMVTCYVK